MPGPRRQAAPGMERGLPGCWSCRSPPAPMSRRRGRPHRMRPGGGRPTPPGAQGQLAHAARPRRPAGELRQRAPGRGAGPGTGGAGRARRGGNGEQAGSRWRGGGGGGCGGEGGSGGRGGSGGGGGGRARGCRESSGFCLRPPHVRGPLPARAGGPGMGRRAMLPERVRAAGAGARESASSAPTARPWRHPQVKAPAGSVPTCAGPAPVPQRRLHLGCVGRAVIALVSSPISLARLAGINVFYSASTTLLHHHSASPKRLQSTCEPSSALSSSGVQARTGCSNEPPTFATCPSSRALHSKAPTAMAPSYSSKASAPN